MNTILLQQHLHLATGTTVSTQSVRNRLHAVVYMLPDQWYVLTARHRGGRRDLTTEHMTCRRREWRNFLFSDASRFSVHPDNKRNFIWRERGTRNNPAFVQGSVIFGGWEVRDNACISIDGRTDLRIIRNGALTGQQYRDEILRPIVVPYAAAVGDDFVLMDENCRPHRAHFVDDSFFEEGTIRLEWPACSPGHEQNRECLGNSRQASCWSPTTPTNSLRTGSSSSGGVEQNTPVSN